MKFIKQYRMGLELIVMLIAIGLAIYVPYWSLWLSLIFMYGCTWGLSRTYQIERYRLAWLERFMPMPPVVGFILSVNLVSGIQKAIIIGIMVLLAGITLGIIEWRLHRLNDGLGWLHLVSLIATVTCLLPFGFVTNLGQLFWAIPSALILWGLSYWIEKTDKTKRWQRMKDKELTTAELA